jgi:hypothetical protein
LYEEAWYLFGTVHIGKSVVKKILKKLLKVLHTWVHSPSPPGVSPSPSSELPHHTQYPESIVIDAFLLHAKQGL